MYEHASKAILHIVNINATILSEISFEITSNFHYILYAHVHVQNNDEYKVLAQGSVKKQLEVVGG